LNLVHLFAHLAWPIIPSYARTIHEAIMPAPEIIPWPEDTMAIFLDQVRSGREIQPPHVLFTKIANEQIEEWKARFGGEED
jgi:methionyl-tRNA synthetase